MVNKLGHRHKNLLLWLTPFGQAMTARVLARQKEQHQLEAVFISALMAQKNRPLSSPLPMLWILLNQLKLLIFLGNVTTAMIHAIDTRRDIAILRTELTGAGIAIRQNEPLIGSHVCALGNSFGLGTGMTCGIVSAVRRSNIGFNDIEDFIQTDAAVNPGMSGGALVDPQGRLVGLIDGIFTKKADIDAGVNFAISVPLIQQSLASQLKAGVQF